MSSYKYCIVNQETGVVQNGIVHEWPEADDDTKRKMFEDALDEQGFELVEFEKMWVN